MQLSDSCHEHRNIKVNESVFHPCWILLVVQFKQNVLEVRLVDHWCGLFRNMTVDIKVD